VIDVIDFRNFNLGFRVARTLTPDLARVCAYSVETRFAFPQVRRMTAIVRNPTVGHVRYVPTSMAFATGD
jgi:hypothetical protein